MKLRIPYILIVCVYMTIDVIFIILAFHLVVLLRSHTVSFNVWSKSLFAAADPYRLLFLAWAILILFFHYIHGLYQTHREQLESMEIWEVVKSTVLSTLSIIVLTFLLKAQE